MKPFGLALLALLILSGDRVGAQALDGGMKRCLRQGLAKREAPAGQGGSDAFAVMAVEDGTLLWRSEGKALAQVEAGPGSLFKVISAYAALDGRKVDPEERIRCGPGRKALGPKAHPVRCWLETGHGRVNLRRALAESCNRYFAWLGPKVGTADLLRSARHFGLGRSTGSGLPGELSGSLPSKPSRNMAGRLAVGQAAGLRVTPLQMLSVIGAVANGGRLLSPHPAGVKLVAGQGRGTLENAEALRFIREGLIQASAYGTGSAQGLGTLGLAGKTGTAGWEGMEWRTHGWYLGFAPSARPSLALVVFVHEGRGSKEAATAARQIMEAVKLQWKACAKEEK